MRTFENVSPGVQVQVVVGILLFGFMVSLLEMSRQTGHEQFEEAQATLDAVNLLNTQVDGAVFPLMFELQVDFDLLTANQLELVTRTRAYEAVTEGPRSEGLASLIAAKLQLLEDFKTDQAIFRNSRAIAAQLLVELRALPAFRALHAERAVDAVERAQLEFIGRRDPPAAVALAAALDQAATGYPDLAEIPEWQAFDAHNRTMMRYAAQLAIDMGSIFFLPISQAILDARSELESQFALTSATARRYQIGLFGAGLVLLVFSAAKVVQVSRYVAMIRKANDQLEHRVVERTEALSLANTALMGEKEERERVESRLRLAQKLESIGQLAAGIAHEINTPTQYVSDNIVFVSDAWHRLQPVLDEYERALVKGEKDDGRGRSLWAQADVSYYRDEVPESLQQASAGLGQIGKIVRAMKQFSHPGGDRHQPADLNAAIEGTATVARGEWKYVADLDLDLDPTLPPVTCDVGALNQVMLNLLVNAAHAIGEVVESAPETKGEIRITTRAIGDWVEITVSDTGAGIRPELRDKVFDLFFTTKDVGEGTGQGLAIAHTVVTELHQGTITLESEVGRGTCFRIRLPIRAALSSDEWSSEEPAAKIA